MFHFVNFNPEINKAVGGHHLNMSKVIIYSPPTCHFCHMAKEYFKSKNIAYEDIDVGPGNIEKQKELIQKSGQYGVPVIFIDDKMVLGFDRPKINQLLKTS